VTYLPSCTCTQLLEISAALQNNCSLLPGLSASLTEPGSPCHYPAYKMLIDCRPFSPFFTPKKPCSSLACLPFCIGFSIDLPRVTGCFGLQQFSYVKERTRPRFFGVPVCFFFVFFFFWWFAVCMHSRAIPIRSGGHSIVVRCRRIPLSSFPIHKCPLVFFGRFSAFYSFPRSEFWLPPAVPFCF